MIIFYIKPPIIILSTYVVAPSGSQHGHPALRIPGACSLCVICSNSSCDEVDVVVGVVALFVLLVIAGAILLLDLGDSAADVM